MGRSEEFPLLRHYGLMACEIRGDGNCLFNALSDQLFGHQNNHQEIRMNVIQYMRENPDGFKPFITVGQGQRRNPKRKNAGAFSSQFSFEPSTDEQTERAWDQHLERMSQGGTYGDNIEIRAFSQAYSTDVQIYQYDYSYYVRAAEDGVARPVAHIAYHTWEHYSSIRNIDGPFMGLPNVKVKNLSPEENAMVNAGTRNAKPIYDWMVKAVSTSLPNLSVDEATIRKTLEEYGGNVNNAVSKLLDSEYLSSNPPSPGSFSQSGSSSIERDPDSDDDEIYGPNKRQNRRISRATKALRKANDDIVAKIEAESQPIPTIELTEPDSKVSSELPVLSHDVPQVKPTVRKAKKDDDNDDWVAPSDDENDNDFHPEEDNDASSSYSASSRSQSVHPDFTVPPCPQPRIILRTKSMQKQNGPQQKKRITARERKDLKKAAQKQARKESKRNNVGQHPAHESPASTLIIIGSEYPPRKLATSTTIINRNRNSPPMEQVIGMKTLYI